MHPDAELAGDAIKMAAAVRGGRDRDRRGDLPHRSRIDLHRRRFHRNCAAGSGSGSRWARVGSCFDNAASEAFFSTLEHEVLSRHQFTHQAEDITAVEADMARLLVLTDGQVLTTLPGVKAIRAACFSAFTLPIRRFPTAEHLYSATGLAPASYQSASIERRCGISRQGLPEHRDALMAIAWGLSQYCPPFIEREEQLRTRGMRPMQVRVAIARHACRLVFRMLTTQDDFDEQRYRRARHQTGR